MRPSSREGTKRKARSLQETTHTFCNTYRKNSGGLSFMEDFGETKPESGMQ